MKLLHIDSSVLGPHSVSRQVSAAIVDRLRQTTPGLEIIYRDLSADAAGASVGLASRGRARRDARRRLQHDLAAGQAVLDEFLAADIVVLGAPMYNFTIPSQLKAWIDRIVVAGKTFKYGAQGPEGLAGNKRVIVAISRGGFYGAGTPAAVGRTSGNLSALGVRLHRRRESRIHFRRRHPGRTRTSREGAGGRAASGDQSSRGLRRCESPPSNAAAGRSDHQRSQYRRCDADDEQATTISKDDANGYRDQELARTGVIAASASN